MLSPDAMVPTRSAAGVILHFEVDDVEHAATTAQEAGARLLLEPTEWGMETSHDCRPRGDRDQLLSTAELMEAGPR